METKFYIRFTIKTTSGFESFGQFFIGNEEEDALLTFKQLKGTTEVNKDAVLQLEFIEANKGLPLNIKLIWCSLEEMAENCKIITKEVFKQFSLGG